MSEPHERDELKALKNALAKNEDAIVQINIKYRELNGIIDKKNAEIEKLTIILNECNKKKEELEKEIMPPEEFKKLLMELESIKKESKEQIDLLRKEIEELKGKKVKAPEVSEKKVESMVEKYIKAKEAKEEKLTEKQRDMIRIMDGKLTGSAYYSKWNELPMSWDQMRTEIPMELFTETKLMKDIGKDNWEALSELEKSSLIAKNLIGFSELKETIETRREYAAEVKEHLQEVLGGDIPSLKKGESFRDMYERTPFTMFFEGDMYEPERIKAHFNAMESLFISDPPLLKKVELETLERARKIYDENKEKIKAATTPEAKYNAAALIAGDLNFLKTKMKRIHYGFG